MNTLHHAAANLLGNDADERINIDGESLNIHADPTLEHALKDVHGNPSGRRLSSNRLGIGLLTSCQS